MIDTILTILGTLIFLPWVMQLISNPWQKTTWHRQLLVVALTFELIAVLHVPLVMYIGLGILLLSFSIYLIKERPKMRFTPFFVTALLYLVWYAVSLLWSADLQKGVLFLSDNGLVLVSISAITCFVQLKKDEYIQILQLFCYAACVFVVLCLLSWVISSYEIHLALWEWPILEKTLVGRAQSYTWLFRFLGGMDGYIHPSYNLLPVFIAMPIAAWLKKETKKYRFVWYFLWINGLLLTLLAQSRMGIIYTAIIFVCNTIYVLSSHKMKIFAASSFLIIGVIFGVLSKNFWEDYGSDQTRNLLQQYTLRYIQAKPLTGAGAGALNPIEICHTIHEDFWPRLGYISPEMRVADWKPKTRMLPHNQWMADWAHAGIIAALIALALYVCIAMRCNVMKNYWGGVFLLIFTIFSLLEPPLYIGKGLYIFCLLSSLIYIAPNKAIIPKIEGS